MDMRGVKALLERRCGAWNVHAVFMLVRDSKPRSRQQIRKPDPMIRLSRALLGLSPGKAGVVRLFKTARIILKSYDCNASRIRRPTVLSMIGANPAAAFNRAGQREGILNAGFEKLSSSTRQLSIQMKH
jgi:hypothetical protein